MRFFVTYNAAEQGPPNPEKMAAIGAFADEVTKAGVLLDTGGLLPPSMGGARVQMTGGKFSITDGPFPETKELIVGYAIVQAKSRDEAIEVCRRFMAVAGDGTGEIRQMSGPNDPPHH
ncbi:MAG TPA: YciI family protein [Kofleriaceae bacterium]|jgi:hypothetical protein|nr:YciI family protein [Kofleriaceae bacterium]